MLAHVQAAVDAANATVSSAEGDQAVPDPAGRPHRGQRSPDPDAEDQARGGAQRLRGRPRGAVRAPLRATAGVAAGQETGNKRNPPEVEPGERKFAECGFDKSRPVGADCASDLNTSTLWEITMARAVGIDLGTTNSAVAVLEGGEPTIIANAEGGRTTPSVVAFSKSGEVLVGEIAKRQAVTNVDRTIRSVKRHMGTDWSQEIDGKKYTAQEISARILQKLKRDSEAYLGEPVTDAVITVPAYFDDARAPGDQGGRRDRGPERPAHHQRAHRGRAGLRPRQGQGGRAHPRLRPRRRHLRRLPARGRQGPRGQLLDHPGPRHQR